MTTATAAITVSRPFLLALRQVRGHHIQADTDRGVKDDRGTDADAAGRDGRCDRGRRQ
jgi:hypothetical protein